MPGNKKIDFQRGFYTRQFVDALHEVVQADLCLLDLKRRFSLSDYQTRRARRLVEAIHLGQVLWPPPIKNIVDDEMPSVSVEVDSTVAGTKRKHVAYKPLRFLFRSEHNRNTMDCALNKTISLRTAHDLLGLTTPKEKRWFSNYMTLVRQGKKPWPPKDIVFAPRGVSEPERSDVVIRRESIGIHKPEETAAEDNGTVIDDGNSCRSYQNGTCVSLETPAKKKVDKSVMERELVNVGRRAMKDVEQLMDKHMHEFYSDYVEELDLMALLARAAKEYCVFSKLPFLQQPQRQRQHRLHEQPEQESVSHHMYEQTPSTSTSINWESEIVVEDVVTNSKEYLQQLETFDWKNYSNDVTRERETSGVEAITHQQTLQLDDADEDVVDDSSRYKCSSAGLINQRSPVKYIRPYSLRRLMEQGKIYDWDLSGEVDDLPYHVKSEGANTQDISFNNTADCNDSFDNEMKKNDKQPTPNLLEAAALRAKQLIGHNPVVEEPLHKWQKKTNPDRSYRNNISKSKRRHTAVHGLDAVKQPYLPYAGHNIVIPLRSEPEESSVPSGANPEASGLGLVYSCSRCREAFSTSAERHHHMQTCNPKNWVNQSESVPTPTENSTRVRRKLKARDEWDSFHKKAFKLAVESGASSKKPKKSMRKPKAQDDWDSFHKKAFKLAVESGASSNKTKKSIIGQSKFVSPKVEAEDTDDPEHNGQRKPFIVFFEEDMFKRGC